jgi:N-hydroxyarylamine O-acetyltransferase
MLVNEYLERVGFDRTPAPDLETLVALHRAHLLAIPYENLEIQLGRENTLSDQAFRDKLVRQGRGGWCYEMNGLFTAVLSEIGFSVSRVGGAVARELKGEESIGNHMVALVDLDRRYVADVGLSDGHLEPFPLEERSWKERGLEFRLEKLRDGWWRFHNHEHGLAPRFDFTEEQRTLDWYQPKCTELQTVDHSPFVGLAMAVRCLPEGVRGLIDATLIEVHDGARSEQRLSSSGEYRRVLTEILGTDLGAEAETLWRKVDARVRERAQQANKED